mmetsp:Transcript_43875/g.103309  ORF Transcript_43875/g.103309 Transcript_43875/m.103309 type:complete len:206 (-) Transcript_43875:634-1251(-)
MMSEMRVAASSWATTAASSPAEMEGSLRAASSDRAFRPATSRFSRSCSASPLEALDLEPLWRLRSCASSRRTSSLHISWSPSSRFSIVSMLILAAWRVSLRRAFSDCSFRTASAASTPMLEALPASSRAAFSFSSSPRTSLLFSISSRCALSSAGGGGGAAARVDMEDCEEAEVRIMVLACFSCWISASCCRTWLMSLSFSSAMA